MQIKLNYGKFVRIDSYPNGSIVEVPDNCTVRELLAILKLPSYLQKSLTVRVNSEPVWLATVLKEEDDVNLLRAVCGG